MSKRPVIGITMSCNDHRLTLGCACETAIKTAGGVPLPLPLHIDRPEAFQLAALCDGILFSGGVDLDPVWYGEEALNVCGVIDQARDVAEKNYFDAAQTLAMPVFGICRGHQIVNVFLGGTLYQDLDTQFPREKPLQHALKGPCDTPIHAVTPVEGSRLYTVTEGKSVRVTSTHHQAIGTVANSLQVVARTADGVIEALESVGDDRIMTVQWHPELRFEQDDHALRLFQGWVETAARYTAKKKGNP